MTTSLLTHFQLDLATNYTLVNLLNIPITIPQEMLKDGYVAIDKDGDMWLYDHKPECKPARYLWDTVGDSDLYRVNYSACDMDSWKAYVLDDWERLCFKLADLPVYGV